LSFFVKALQFVFDASMRALVEDNEDIILLPDVKLDILEILEELPELQFLQLLPLHQFLLTAQEL
jgi:hypothetical protein